MEDVSDFELRGAVRIQLSGYRVSIFSDLVLMTNIWTNFGVPARGTQVAYHCPWRIGGDFHRMV